MKLYFFAVVAVLASAVPDTMRAVRTKLFGCQAPFSCVDLKTVPTPVPKAGEVLIRVNGSSVNPSDVDTVEAGGCVLGCGADVAGTVVACPGCTRLKVGDEVWTLANPAYAEFVVASESQTSLKPKTASFLDAGVLPEVGLTSLFSLKRTGSAPGTPLPAGSPWKGDNLTVVITAGSGGTGSLGIQIARSFGAKHIATSTTGVAGEAFVKKLGATFVVDYKKEDLFDVLPANSVDVVYDNYGEEGTADKAMKALRPGGVYLLLPHGECFVKKTQGPPCLSGNPKPGVTQLNYATGPDFEEYALQGLTELASMVDASQVTAFIDKSFTLDSAAAAFNYSKGPGQGGVGQHIGKIAITV